MVVAVSSYKHFNSTRKICVLGNTSANRFFYVRFKLFQRSHLPIKSLRSSIRNMNYNTFNILLIIIINLVYYYSLKKNTNFNYK